MALRNKENILIKGLVYFSGGQMVNTTKPLEIGAFMAIQGMDPGGYSTLFTTKNMGVVMIKTNRRFTKVSSTIQDGKPRLVYELFLEGDLDEHFDSKNPVNSSAALHEIELEFNQQAQGVVSGLIRNTQADHSDIFGMVKSPGPATLSTGSSIFMRKRTGKKSMAEFR